MLVVEIVRAVLEEDPDRLDRRLANQRRVEVPAGHHRLPFLRRAIRNRRVAPDQADHVAELIGPVPRDGERADGAAARPANRPPCGILRHRVLLPDLGNQLIHEKARVRIRQRVVLRRAVVRVARPEVLRVSLAPLTRRDEDADRRREVLLVNQVLQDLRHSQHALRGDGALAVLEHQEVGRPPRRVLGRDVDPVLPDGVRYRLAPEEDRSLEPALRNPLLGQRIRSRLVGNGGRGGGGGLLRPGGRPHRQARPGHAQGCKKSRGVK